MSRERNPSGRLVRPTRRLELGGGAVVTGRKVGVVVYIRWSSGRLVRRFNWYCSRFGLHARPVEYHGDDPGRPSAYEVVGSYEACAGLVRHCSVTGWHPIVDAPVPRAVPRPGPHDRAPADAPAAVRAEARRRRMAPADRRAADERDRRALLSPAERRAVEAVEAAERAELPPATRY